MDVYCSGASFDLDEFLARPLFAHLATASAEGPRESPVWFLWDIGAIWLVGSSSDSFPKRIVHDPRCALGIVDFDLARGFLQHVGMRGEATVEQLDRSRLHRFLSRYLGPDREKWNRWFDETVVASIDLFVRFQPRSVVMRDQSYFK